MGRVPNFGGADLDVLSAIMAYTRRRHRIAHSGRVTLRLSPAQRDLFLHSPELPQGLGHTLHRAHVREGKLTARVTRGDLDVLIAVAAKVSAADRRSERELDTLLRYLEGLEDRFAEPQDENTDG